MTQGLKKLILLLMADLLAFASATALAIACTRSMPSCVAHLALAALAFVLLSAFAGLYRNTWPQTKPELDSVRELRAQCLVPALTLLLVLASGTLFKIDNSPRFAPCIILATLPFLLFAWRSIVRKCFKLPYQHLVENGNIAVKRDRTATYGLRLPIPRLFKFVFEKLLALTALVVFLPLFLLLALIVKLNSTGPALYFSTRIGKNGKRFNIVKFRTMNQNADAQIEQILADSPESAKQWNDTVKLDNDPRVTSFGRFLRKTSLDELPQLWNVLVGHMAIIGPRPIVDREIEKYGEHYSTLVSVKPGMTGLWQVSGRNELTYEQRVALDAFYIEHWSFWLDLYILINTVREVLSAHGK